MTSQVDLLLHLQGVVYLYAQVANRALEFSVAE